MGKESWVDNGHVRRTSEDGRESYLYKVDSLGETCVEVTKHHEKGTTDASPSDSYAAGTDSFLRSSAGRRSFRSA